MNVLYIQTKELVHNYLRSFIPIYIGGLLVATTWDHLDMLMLRSAIMESVLGFPPPPPEMDPMSLSQGGLFQQMVKASNTVSFSTCYT